MKTHKFNYDLITTKGKRIKSSRNFKHRQHASRVLNMFYPGCVIVNISTDGAGGYAHHLYMEVGI